MSNQRYSREFRDEAVRQILEGGHSTSEVAARLGVSANSLYKWVKAVQPNTDSLKDEELIEAKRENLKLRAELRRVTEERDILKKAALGSIDRRNRLSSILTQEHNTVVTLGTAFVSRITSNQA